MFDAALQQTDSDANDQRLESMARVVHDALHELNNALGAVRSFAEHAEHAIDRDGQMADIRQIQQVAQRAVLVVKELNDSLRYEAPLRAGVSAPAVAARVVERLRRDGAGSVSLTVSPANDPLIVPTARERVFEQMLSRMAGSGADQPSAVHVEVSSAPVSRGVDAFDLDAQACVVVRVIRDRDTPGNALESRNAAVAAAHCGGTMTFRPDPWSWHEAEAVLPAVDPSLTARRPPAPQAGNVVSPPEWAARA